MLRATPRLALAALLFVVPACGSSPQCVIDTDCPLGLRCASDRTCQPRGGASDAGPRIDAAVRDAAADSSAMMDAPAGEGGIDDAAIEDAEIDAEIDAEVDGGGL